METRELIASLARDAGPVEPLPAPGRRATAWLAGAALYVAAFAVLAFLRNPAGPATEPLYWLQRGTSALLALTAAVAAFRSVVPGRTPAVGWPLAAAAAWAVTVIGGTVHDVRSLGTLGLAGQTDWPCVVSLSVGGGLLWTALWSMLTRGAPLTPGLTAALGGLAAVAVANIGACVLQPHAFNSVILVWHGLTAAAVIALLTAIGGRMFTWRSVLQRALTARR
ncbi:MAG: NrsF family protein [Vicinamibacterales bacterium]